MVFEPQPLAVALQEQDHEDFKDETDGMYSEADSVKDEDDEDDVPLIFHKANQKKLKVQERNNNIGTLPARPKRSINESKTKCSPKISKKRQSKRNTKSTRNDQHIEDATPLKEDPALIINDAHKDKKSSRDKTKEFDAFIAEWKQELECATCSKTVTNFDQLREHFHADHPNETCYAKCCDRKFSKRFYLFEHLQLHIKPDTYKCDICGRCNSSSRNLAKHIHERHTKEGKERPFQCEICQKNFTNKFTLRRHLELHESARDHKCSECGKGFATEQRRKVHERMVHHDVDRICDQCGKQVHGVYALRQHLLGHKGVEKRKYSCDQCGTQLTSNASLKRHKEQKHHDGTTAYICRECGKIFNSQTALLRHKKIVHIIERKFKCSICEKGFKFPQYLREHMASHTGIDLYECPHCPKTFKVRSNLHHHRKRVHPKEWSEARVSKLPPKKININLVSNEIVI